MRNQSRHRRYPGLPRGLPGRVSALLLCALLGGHAAPANALLRIDFEQKFFIHPGQQVWDFCVVRSDSLYHIFYIAYPESIPGAHCYALGHATSPDLAHWTIQPWAVPAGPDWWDADNVWAPDVVWDADRGRWTLYYTGVDSLKIQRLCAAHSPDLGTWTKDPANPLFEPDSLRYYWSPTAAWSSFRDPFVFFRDGVWNLLSTAGLRVGGYPGTKNGIIHRLTSPDLGTWEDQGPFFRHDGVLAWHDMESTQYLERGGWHHLFFTEQDISGVSHIASDSLGGWTTADTRVIDYGNAAEIDQFDPGIDVFSRYVVGQHRLTGALFYVVRFDTLNWLDGGLTPSIYKPHPLDSDWASRTGGATLGQPTFGDNPVERGEPSAGPVGNGWFGSQEYYQGPLSGRGAPGSRLGDTAVGECVSRPFSVTGDFIRLLVGGGNYPATCYVALMDADADTVLLRETGTGVDLMTPRQWNVRPYRGRRCCVKIVDAETGPFGHINVDEIEEIVDGVTAVTPPGGPAAAPPLQLRGAHPNPFNPAVEVAFTLGRRGQVQLIIHDPRGRLVWRSPAESRAVGPQTISWRGSDLDGRPAAAGAYLYSVLLDGRTAAGGKFSLVK
ncbi:MAG: FlgD immunoglobulin-like domain containing protein [Candidatus Krumholzibacteriia bacterium]